MATCFAPAKVNLFLHVTGRRADGYHTLESLIFFADIADRLTVQPADSTSLSSHGPFAAALPAANDNIVMETCRLLKQHYPEIPDVRITLEKNLPVAAGIGGGSGDAAAAARAVLALADIQPEPEKIVGVLQTLGAEMPVCYHAKPALVEGIGERLTFWPDLPDWGIVLVNPQVPLRTRDVFAGVKNYGKAGNYPIPKTPADWLELAAATGNDLQRPAEKIVAEIPAMLAALKTSAHCLLARMSGSGATCFGLYAGRARAKEAAEILQTRYPQWWVKSGGMWREQ